MSGSQGPVSTLHEAQQLVDKGVINEDTVVWCRDFDQTWRKLGEVVDRFPGLKL